MKVLILTSNYPRRNALNNGIFIHQQVKALQQLGVECHVLLLRNWYPPIGLHSLHPMWQKGHRQHNIFFEELDGVQIHSVPMFVKMPARFFPESYYERAERSLIKYIKQNKELQDADWIYAHFLTDNAYIASRIKKQLNIKVAAITRGDDVHAWPEQDPSLIGNIRYVFEHADLMLANNKRLGDDALKFADKKVPEFKVVYNGINYKDFEHQAYDTHTLATLKKTYNLPENKKILLCIGRAEYMKGWNELLEVIAEGNALTDEWVLLAVTDNPEGRYAVNVTDKVAQLGLQDKVYIQKNLPHDKVKELYWLSDAFILPSYNEGLSNAVLEAMSSGLWVITTDVGGHAEIIENGVSGFLIQPKSKDAIKESLQYLMAHFEMQKDSISKHAIASMHRLGDYAKNAGILLNYLTEKH